MKPLKKVLRVEDPGRHAKHIPSVSAERRRNMSAIRSVDTLPEQEFRRAFALLGFRYRVHSSAVIGRPDLSNRRQKWAVFIDGCFWHGCPKHYREPVVRAAYWRQKLAANRRRRVRVTGRLKRQGWRVATVWEHSIESDPGLAALAVGLMLADSDRGPATRHAPRGTR